MVYSNIKKHKIFISFYHRDDQEYKDYIVTHLGKNFINKSVEEGEYDPDDSDEYIKRLIREEKISDSSVIVVLIGHNTYKRKHVDWEIYAGLRKSINGASGLVGIILPGCVDAIYPHRFMDNLNTGYAKVYTWEYAKKYYDEIINEAFDNRIRLKDKINNSRPQMKRNL